MVSGEGDIGNIVMVYLRVFRVDQIDSRRLRKIRTRIANDVIIDGVVRIALRLRGSVARKEVRASTDDDSRAGTIKTIISLNSVAVAAVVQLHAACSQVLKHAVFYRTRIRVSQHQGPRHFVGIFAVVQAPQHFPL